MPNELNPRHGCKHAASGCGYPSGECAGLCAIHRRVRAGTTPPDDLALPTRPISVDDDEPGLTPAGWATVVIALMLAAVMAAIALVR